MGSALLDDVATETREAPGPHRESVEGRAATGSSALRQQAAERVAAHRIRRTGDGMPAAVPSSAPRNARSAKIAAAVAERYAQTQSYRDFLAAEAEHALQQARAVAEIAALHAQALEEAKQTLLDTVERKAGAIGESWADKSLKSPRGAASETEQASSAAPLLWQEPEDHCDGAESQPERHRFQPPQPRARARRKSENRTAVAPETTSIPSSSPTQTLADGITIRLYQDESGVARVTLDPPAASSVSLAGTYLAARMQSDEEAFLLDEEIAFRQEPVFEELAGPAEPLPANLIEFPRQLVAARKARPRLAEGPLLAEAEDASGTGQLRIFEVAPEEIAVTPKSDTTAEATHTAQWSSILLETQPHAEARPFPAGTHIAQTSNPATLLVTRGALADVAPLQRRITALAINAGILATAFAVFAVVFLSVAAHAPWSYAAAPSTLAGILHTLIDKATISAALPFAACAFALLVAIYQALFFTLSTATPGMRLARIAFCTFSDENPSRAAIRRRLPVLLLSALPLGFGFLWAALDEERLTWHDRICCIYQRSY